MSIIKSILAPTDFSELSADGVRYACRLARELSADLVIFNVVVLDESNTVDKHEMEQHRRLLEEFVAGKITGAAVGLKIRQIVESGLPFRAILDWVAKERVDLIVMSSHGRSGLARMLIGSVTDRVLRASPCPVLVVPAEKQQ